MRKTQQLNTNHTHFTRNSSDIFFFLSSQWYRVADLRLFLQFSRHLRTLLQRVPSGVGEHFTNKKKIERNWLETLIKCIGKFVADPFLVARQFSLFLVEPFGYTTAATSSSSFCLFSFLFFSSTTYGNFGNVIARSERNCQQLRFDRVLSNSARRLTQAFAQFTYVNWQFTNQANGQLRENWEWNSARYRARERENREKK